MIGELAAIFDSLYSRKRKRKPASQFVVFLIGNGIDQVNNLIYHDKLERQAKRRGRKSSAAIETYKWHHFEYSRYYSSNSLPSFAHCCIFRLMVDGLCRDLITTNYDMFFDGIWRRHPAFAIRRNPVLRQDEYHQDHYFSYRNHARRAVRYWKIHGSLSHVLFRDRSSRERHVLVRLPECAVSVSSGQIAKAYGIPTQAPYLGYEQRAYGATSFPMHSDLTPGFEAYIDWSFRNDRARFQREIKGAKLVLRDRSEMAALVILGFSGYFNDNDPHDPWNEELVPEIRRLRAGGFRNVFMAVHENQIARVRHPCYGLMRELDSRKRCLPFSQAGDFMAAVVSSTKHFPVALADMEYENWRNNYYVQMKEGSYA